MTLPRAFVWTVLALLSLSFSISAATRHPLDPLGEAELGTATALVKAQAQFPKEGAGFAVLALREPPKSEVLAGGEGVRREAIAVILDSPRNKTFEAIVDLRAKKVLSWKELPGIQPLILAGEYERLSTIISADPKWQAAVKKRGITDLEQVFSEGWAAGLLVPAKHGKARLMRAICYLRSGAQNFYGRPIEGLIPIVDMNQGKLVELIDTGVVPVAQVTQELDPQSTGPLRTDVKPLEPKQPNGPSFQIDGHEVRWQKWRFRLGMHPREGLVLYDVKYQDGDKLRSILYRASLSETVVPYGDTDPAWAWRSAFDQGEYGMGKFSVALEPGKDLPANAATLDAFFADDDGKPGIRKSRIGLYERDGGVMWRHTSVDGVTDARRSRELVATFTVTIGNYDYIFSWVFKQDGEIVADAGATGIMLPKGVKDARKPAGHHHGEYKHGHWVAPFLAAPHHQHFFSYRLDFDIDGQANHALEHNTRAVPKGNGNPHFNAMMMEERLLETEKQAMRDMNLGSARKWLVRGGALDSGGYALIPADNTVPFVLRESEARKKAGFINHHFWVTRYKSGEVHAAGEYPNQSRTAEGLPKWASDDEPLAKQDLVAWYTLGMTHIPRPEEWPVMPVTHVGFRLAPTGFFARNPALDLP